MSKRMTWNAPERRFFETGLDRGVLYPKGTPPQGPIIATNRATNASFEVASASIVTETNILVNPGAETAGGWTPTVASWTITRDTAVKRSGTQSLKSVVTGTTTSALSITDVGQLTSAGRPAVAATNIISAGVWVMTPQTGYQARIHLLYFDAGSNSVGSSVVGSFVPLTAGQWARPSLIGQTVPANAVSVQLTAVVSKVSGNATVGDVAYADEAMVAINRGLPTYFDGSTAPADDFTYTWSGTAHQSTSTRRHIPVSGLGEGASRVIQSSDWASTGTKSLRLYSLWGNSGSAYTDIGQFAPDWGKQYTVKVKVRVREQLTAKPRIGALTTGYTTNLNAFAEVPFTNGVVAPGEYELKLTFSYPAFVNGAAKYLRLYNYNSYGTSVWFDDLLVMDGDGRDFNGDETDFFYWATPDTGAHDYNIEIDNTSTKREKLTLAVPWEGLTSVEESGGEAAKAYYVDGRPFLYLPVPKEYKANLSAYTYPDEFSAVMGLAEVTDGMYLDSQPGQAFDLSYRTLVGNGIQGVDHGYKIHLVYNATVTPASMSYESLSNSVNPSTLSWEIQAVPVKVEGFRPTAHIVIDTRHMTPKKIQALEEMLYGGEEDVAHMPAPQAVFDLLNYGDTIIVTDNGDGTFEVEGSYENVYMISDGEFRIENIDGENHGDGTFTISTTEG